MNQAKAIRPEKNEAIDHLVKKFSTAKSIFLTDYSGLSVAAMTNLRRNFRKSNVEYIVSKNTLVRIAAEKSGYQALVPHLEGPTALAFGMNDPGAPAKVILDFLKNNPRPTVKAFVFEGQYYESRQTEQIATLPSRQELLAQLAATMNAPLSGLVNSLQGIVRNLVYVLQAVVERKEKTEAGTS